MVWELNGVEYKDYESFVQAYIKTEIPQDSSQIRIGYIRDECLDVLEEILKRDEARRESRQ